MIRCRKFGMLGSVVMVHLREVLDPDPQHPGLSPSLITRDDLSMGQSRMIPRVVAGYTEGFKAVRVTMSLRSGW